jgi:hypothetical protein
MLEAASWRLGSELVRRHPGLLSLYRTHPGGGTYDCLSLRTDEAALIDLNRNGSIHVLERLDGSPSTWRAASWDEYFRSDPRQFLDGLEIAAGLPRPGQVPSSTPTTLTLRILAGIAAAHVKTIHPIDIRSGMLDTSGYGGGRADELFDAFPAIPDDLLQDRPDEPLGQGASRFWFVLRDDAPILALETSTGSAWTSHHSGGVSLLDTYRSRRRNLIATALDVLARADNV